jgi:diguanylate cyclase (GGDEF)-like protein
LPVIMITAETDSDTTVRALKEGANDYITKPVNLDVALARLRTHLELRTATEELERRALYDPLTELPNRTLIADRLERAFARAARSGQLLALLVLDLDGFKDVNDRHGHVVGDLLLVAVARRLTEAARKADTVGRLGGDEFIVLAEDIHRPQEVHIIAARLEETVGRPYEIDGRTLRIGASVGSHVWRPGDLKELDTLLTLADAAMYMVKRARKVS